MLRILVGFICFALFANIHYSCCGCILNHSIESGEDENSLNVLILLHDSDKDDEFDGPRKADTITHIYRI